MTEQELILKDKLLNAHGSITYCWGKDFFIETAIGNFHWSDPGYDGSNIMTLFKGTYGEFIKTINIHAGRDKGFHIVGRYCGDSFTVKIPLEALT